MVSLTRINYEVNYQELTSSEAELIEKYAQIPDETSNVSREPLRYITAEALNMIARGENPNHFNGKVPTEDEKSTAKELLEKLTLKTGEMDFAFDAIIE